MAPFLAETGLGKAASPTWRQADCDWPIMIKLFDEFSTDGGGADAVLLVRV